MSITLDDQAVDVFKLYDEMTIACTKDIEGYKALIEAIEVMIAQKQKKLQEIKDNTIELLTKSISSTDTVPTMETPLPQKGKKFNYAGIEMEALSGKAVESGKAAVEKADAVEQSQAIIPSIPVKKTRPAHNNKTAGKVKAKRSGKTKKPSLRTKQTTAAGKDDQPSPKKVSRTESTSGTTELKCKYHPESPAMDIARQLCSSCKWKLTTNGLKKFDTDPAVISFLKGETTEIPDLGQSMCPVHPSVPSYNQKTGLCKTCQKKAKEYGVSDRPLTEIELTLLRNPVS